MTNYSAPDSDVIDFKFRIAVVLVGGLLLVFTAGQLNLLLGSESSHSGTMVKLTALNQARNFLYTFESDGGQQFERKVAKMTHTHVGLNPGDKVTFVVDGLFWSKVVAVDKGDGLKRLP